MMENSLQTEQYCISGIWASAVKEHISITHVMLHRSNTNNSFSRGKKVNADKIVKLIRSRKATIHTIEWSYKFQEWQKGTEVGFETVDDVEYLRTKKENKLFDNLNNLLPMKVLMASLAE